MKQRPRFLSYFLVGMLSLIAMAAAKATIFGGRFNVNAQNSAPTAQLTPEALLDGFRHVEVASVSDAAEKILGTKIYMSHRMQSIFPAKFAGFAVTVLLKKDEGNKDPNALAGMMAAIDAGEKDSVYVMTVEGGADIAGMGGLMGTAMNARGYVGAVIDGGVRDVAQLKRIGFPVYALGPVPSTSVGRRCNRETSLRRITTASSWCRALKPRKFLRSRNRWISKSTRCIRSSRNTSPCKKQ